MIYLIGVVITWIVRIGLYNKKSKKMIHKWKVFGSYKYVDFYNLIDCEEISKGELLKFRKDFIFKFVIISFILGVIWPIVLPVTIVMNTRE